MYGILKVTLEESENIMPPRFKREWVKVRGKRLEYPTEIMATIMADDFTSYSRKKGILDVGYRAREIPAE